MSGYILYRLRFCLDTGYNLLSSTAPLRRNRGGPNNVIIPEAVCPEGQASVNFTGYFAFSGIPEHMTEDHKKRFYPVGV